jgi:hypothetical protein
MLAPWTPVLVTADLAQGVVAVGVQLVKHGPHLLGRAVWPARGAGRLGRFLSGDTVHVGWATRWAHPWPPYAQTAAAMALRI